MCHSFVKHHDFSFTEGFNATKFVVLIFSPHIDNIYCNSIKKGNLSMLLREYLAWEKIDQKDFAKKAGIAVSSLGNYICGRRFPSSSAINKIYVASDKKVTFEDWSQQFSKK
jgi:hypothetical protein